MKLYKPNHLNDRSLAGRHAVSWVGIASLMLAVVGCKSADKEDPLFGVKPPQVNPVPPATSSNPGGAPRAQAPPIPGNTSAVSTAALASLPGGRPLAINEPRPAQGSNTTVAPSVQPIPRDAGQAPALLTTGSWAQNPPATGSYPPATDNFVDPNFALLQARGASSQKVDQLPQGVRLTVLVPNRANPGAVRVYEAVERDVATATQAILQQIDAQR